MNFVRIFLVYCLVLAGGLFGMRCDDPEIMGISLRGEQILIHLRTFCRDKECEMAWYAFHDFVVEDLEAVETVMDWQDGEVVRVAYHRGMRLGYGERGTRGWLNHASSGRVLLGKIVVTRPVEIVDEAATEAAAPTTD